jgi:hypothetical protein
MTHKQSAVLTSVTVARRLVQVGAAGRYGLIHRLITALAVVIQREGLAVTDSFRTSLFKRLALLVELAGSALQPQATAMLMELTARDWGRHTPECLRIVTAMHQVCCNACREQSFMCSH